MGTESLNRDSLGIVDAPLADSEVCGGNERKNPRCSLEIETKNLPSCRTPSPLQTRGRFLAGIVAVGCGL